jgi:hypothetical protein
VGDLVTDRSLNHPFISLDAANSWIVLDHWVFLESVPVLVVFLVKTFPGDQNSWLHGDRSVLVHTEFQSPIVPGPSAIPGDVDQQLRWLQFQVQIVLVDPIPNVLSKFTSIIFVKNEHFLIRPFIFTHFIATFLIHAFISPIFAPF